MTGAVFFGITAWLLVLIRPAFCHACRILFRGSDRVAVDRQQGRLLPHRLLRDPKHLQWVLSLDQVVAAEGDRNLQ